MIVTDCPYCLYFGVLIFGSWMLDHRFLMIFVDLGLGIWDVCFWIFGFGLWLRAALGTLRAGSPSGFSLTPSRRSEIQNQNSKIQTIWRPNSKIQTIWTISDNHRLPKTNFFCSIKGLSKVVSPNLCANKPTRTAQGISPQTLPPAPTPRKSPPNYMENQ